MSNIKLAADLAEPTGLKDESGRKKPKRRLAPCFACGNHLRGTYVTKLKNKHDGLSRNFHKACTESFMKGSESSDWEY